MYLTSTWEREQLDCRMMEMMMLTLNNLTSSRYFCLSNLIPPRESRWKASIPMVPVRSAGHVHEKGFREDGRNSHDSSSLQLVH